MIGRFVRGAKPPPSATRRYHPIVRPEPGKKLLLTFLGQELWGFWTHDVRGATTKDFRSKLCPGHRDCDPDRHEMPSRWWGFGACVVEPTQQFVIAQLTLYGADQVERYAIRNHGLRRLTVEVVKEHDAASGAFLVRPSDRWCRAELPQAFDMEESLCHIFGVDKLPEYTRDNRGPGEDMLS